MRGGLGGDQTRRDWLAGRYAKMREHVTSNFTYVFYGLWKRSRRPSQHHRRIELFLKTRK